jgi:hypothetical protein
MARNQSANVKHRYEDGGIDAAPVDVSATDFVMGTACRGIIVGTSGDLEVTTLMGNKRILKNIPTGVIPLCVTTIHNANTTASDLSVIY